MRVAYPNDGYLRAFDAQGEPLDVYRAGLLAIEAQQHLPDLFRSLTNDRGGFVWLVSDRPGYTAGVVGAHVGYNPIQERWGIGYLQSGTANFPGFTLESGLAALHGMASRFDGCEGLPDSVRQTATGRVGYRDGIDPAALTPVEVIVPTCDLEVLMRACFAISHVIPEELVPLTWKRTNFFDLLRAAESYCARVDGLEYRELEVLLLAVSESHRDRVTELYHRVTGRVPQS